MQGVNLFKGYVSVVFSDSYQHLYKSLLFHKDINWVLTPCKRALMLLCVPAAILGVLCGVGNYLVQKQKKYSEIQHELQFVQQIKTTQFLRRPGLFGDNWHIEKEKTKSKYIVYFQ